MSLPSSLNAYPSSMLTALQRAARDNAFIIPCDDPIKLRFRFYGFRKALIKAGEHAALAESVTFTLQTTPPGLIISHVDKSPEANIIENALGQTPVIFPTRESIISDTEDMMDRILGRVK